MNADGHAEPHANTLLAQILRGLGIDAKAETVGHAGRRIPDIAISGESKIILEAEYGKPAEAQKDADKRLTDAGVVGALSYPPIFKNNFEEAIRTGARIDFAFKKSADGAGGWENRWRAGTAYDLAQLLRRPDAIVRMPHDEIQDAVVRIKNDLKYFSAMMLSDQPRYCEDLATLLQASLPVAGGERKVALEHSVRLAGLILVGAFLFQFALAAKNKKVKNPNDFESADVSIVDIDGHWRFILENINYAAIFRVALAVLRKGNVGKASAMRMAATARSVQNVARDGVDLMGVVYHKLLAELAKPLGAYYTTIPAATMLSALALSPQKWGTKWMTETKKFRVADLACGSGTLLAAACGQVRDNVMREYMRKILDAGNVPFGRPEILDRVQRELLENVVWGYDVLETAAHLTATTLGLMSPEVDFRKSHIYCAAVGVKSSGAALAGSFQLLDSERVQKVLFDADVDEKEKRIAHVETGEESSAPMPPLDLCIMNPPFVVGRKNALSYSFLQPEHAEAVRRKMNALAKRHNFSNAGLGPGFVVLGEKYIKEGGRMAFIMTATIASGRGAAWAGARRTIEKSCDLEYLITGSQFSFNTNKQECMFVARKRKNGETPKTHALFCVLSGDLEDGNMAHAAAREILAAGEDGGEWGELRIAGRLVGEFARLRYRGRETWDGIAFANLRLTAAADMLADAGKLPYYSDDDSAIPMRPLEKLAAFGSYRLHRYTNAPQVKEKARRYLGFSKPATRYAGYYPGYQKSMTGIGQKDILHISENPNCHFLPLPKCDAWAKKYFSWGGRIVVNTSFGFNSSRRLASLISVPVQGANYQPVRLHNDSDERAKAMVLWLNSTPATMLMAAYSVGCGGAKVMLSQKAVGDMPVLDLDALTAAQIKSLSRAFDKIAEMEFMPIPKMAEDPARRAIDDALAKTLRLRGFDFAALREALAAESIICGK